MITENAKGAQRSFSLKVYVQMDEEGDAQFLEYLAPADVRGTKFLSVKPKDGESQMGCTCLLWAGSAGLPRT